MGGNAGPDMGEGWQIQSKTNSVKEKYYISEHKLLKLT